ncbi:hypothetical protein [Stutzerimonas kunmingensis]|uniref:hypothetical protein n=1 Tax=Stutzerimonas kunmingensis TaxID=1211807 RepID=UPI0028AA9E16|nr:hypothetical protein [Stutzerimonas kunmingensis]
MIANNPKHTALTLLCLIIVPLVIAYYAMGLDKSGLDSPFIYEHLDDIWQFTLTKVLKETGWILYNPYLGAPEVASWHYHSAAQTSALHSIIMLAMSPFFDSAITLQQTYFILNFPLIAITAYWACRLLCIARLPAISAALLFAFCTYRFNILIYSFLPNYFCIPLAMVAIIWTFQGKFDETLTAAKLPVAVKALLKNKSFLLGLFFIILIALSDGYYAFFSLLLFGCAGAIRLIVGGWKKPRILIPAILYIAVLVVVSLLIQLPLYQYKKSHHDEFYQNNIADPVLQKFPHESEVYSSSLKLLITPNQQHHVSALGHVGDRLVESSNAARKIAIPASITLGIFGTALLFLSFTLLMVPQLRRSVFADGGTTSEHNKSFIGLGDSLLAIIFFVFLASISGGLGTLIAFVFPTIRAYNRFPIFMEFALLLLGALIASRALSTFRRPAVIAAALVLITALGIYDQTPANVANRSPDIRPRVAQETAFVKQLESELPKDAMVYQFPYSQYLTNNKYYGWGSFNHIRLYLFSEHIHWSNGGSKNSPADNWNRRISKLPIDALLNEIQAVGFKALVIDRIVVKDDEFAKIKLALQALKLLVVEDPSGRFAHVLLPQANFKVSYSKDYTAIDSLTINAATPFDKNAYPELIDAEKLEHFLNDNRAPFPLRIERTQHPEIFKDVSLLTKGGGDSAILPITDLNVTLTCTALDKQQRVAIDLNNNGTFNLSLGQGSFPISVGVHVKGPDGKMLLWDSGYRMAGGLVVKPGEKKRLVFDLKDYTGANQYTADPANSLQFELVQDGNTWFSNASCSPAP